MRAGKQKAYNFCCGTGRQQPKLGHLLFPATAGDEAPLEKAHPNQPSKSPQVVVLELKWFTQQFSIPEWNLIKTSFVAKKYFGGEEKL